MLRFIVESLKVELWKIKQHFRFYKRKTLNKTGAFSMQTSPVRGESLRYPVPGFV